MCNLSDVYMERGRREGMEKGLEKGREEGREEGLEEGLEKGREEGIVLGREEGRNEGIGIGKIKTLKELVEDGTLTLKAAAEKADMSVEEFKIIIQNI